MNNDEAKNKKWYDIGKISYSNIPDYIGVFLQVTELNYNRIVENIKYILKDPKTFEENRDKILFHIIENKEKIPVNVGQNIKSITNLTHVLHIIYTMDNVISLTMLYDSKYPTEVPVRFNLPNILSDEFKKNCKGKNKL
jgi:hypothetical protein